LLRNGEVRNLADNPLLRDLDEVAAISIAPEADLLDGGNKFPHLSFTAHELAD